MKVAMIISYCYCHHYSTCSCSTRDKSDVDFLVRIHPNTLFYVLILASWAAKQPACKSRFESSVVSFWTVPPVHNFRSSSLRRDYPACMKCIVIYPFYMVTHVPIVDPNRTLLPRRQADIQHGKASDYIAGQLYLRLCWPTDCWTRVYCVSSCSSRLH